MTPPDPLDELASALFDAARRERPTDDVRARVLAGARGGAGDAARPASERTMDGGSTASRRGPLYAALLAAAVLACLGLLRLRDDEPVLIGPEGPSARRAVPEPKAPEPSRAEPSVRAEPAPEEPKRAAPRVTTHSVPDVPPSATVPPPRAPATLTEEVEALDRARAALTAGNAAGALRFIEDYEQVLHGTRLTEEATLLRVEALIRSGRPAAARELGLRFIESNPGSPLAERARSLVSGVGSRGSKSDAGGS